MRLERLHLSGFKSFSERAEVAFDRGVTAIVGPNGCGKSNLADAITWVLGEQSAKSLRGDSMEDVIFGGSDARKPTGSAEVRLRLSGIPLPGDERETAGPAGHSGDQAPGDLAPGGLALEGQASHPDRGTVDVEVTRRLYRSGESEYLIDGAVCRLKDVHELLMDTGLGAKAYSIIEQGKIGQILSSRPADRRALIEEAAGITKYKSRRRSAELKLEAARQNLSRVDDLVFEVDRQRASLKRQVAKARRYGRLREEMRFWERRLYAQRYRMLAEVIDAARTRVGDARRAEAQAASLHDERERALLLARKGQETADQTAAAAREAAHRQELENGQRRAQLALDTSQADMLEARAARLELEIQRLDAQRGPSEAAVADRVLAADAAERAREKASEQLQAALRAYADAQRAVELQERAVEQRRSALYAHLSSRAALQAAAHAAAAQRDRAAQTHVRVEGERSDLDIETTRSRELHERAAAELQRASAALERCQSDLNARGSELSAARELRDSRTRALRALEQELAAMQGRQRSLEELDRERAGFSEAARIVLAEANGHLGALGAVADFLEVAPEYERAVEAALGDLLQFVVVLRPEQAQAGLELVRRADAGRCGFLIADRVRGSESATMGAGGAHAVATSARAGTAVGVVAALPLSTVVRLLDPRIALGAAADTLVVTDFETARELAAQTPAPVVTLEGDLFRGTSIVSGGSGKQSRGILATKRQIKELRERVAAEDARRSQMGGQIQELDDTLARLEADLARLGEERQQHETAIAVCRTQVARASEDQARLRARATLVGQELDRTRTEIASLDAQHAEAAAAISSLAQEIAAAEGAFADAQRELANARAAAETAGHIVAEARAGAATLTERAAANRADVQRTGAALDDLHQRLRSHRAELDEVRLQREGLLGGLQARQTAAARDEQTLAQLNDEMRKTAAEAEARRAAVVDHDRALREARERLDAARAVVAELDLTRVTAEADLTHLAQQCLDSTGVPLAALAEEIDTGRPVEPAEAADADDEESDVEPGSREAGNGTLPSSDAAETPETALARLREAVDRLGPVNMMAIEQFGELETRHTFLSTQRQDLIDSIAQTSEAITRIDTTTHARFREAFQQINGNFQETFTTLFSGGKAGLTLLDEADPLESGLEIVASPPGKRLQNVQLLSGGEKAMTAIALMFAIFRYKPSPFCLLDEIDAPLDDANIGRFVEMLRAMLDRTQFIIITHNRKTMEIANRLYGVTMEEPGVSKLISLQLN